VHHLPCRARLAWHGGAKQFDGSQMRVARCPKFFECFAGKPLEIFGFFFERPLQRQTPQKFALLRRGFDGIEVKSFLVGVGQGSGQKVSKGRVGFCGAVLGLAVWAERTG